MRVYLIRTSGFYYDNATLDKQKKSLGILQKNKQQHDKRSSYVIIVIAKGHSE